MRNRKKKAMKKKENECECKNINMLYSWSANELKCIASLFSISRRPCFSSSLGSKLRRQLFFALRQAPTPAAAVAGN
jgi:hypothetical protein